MGRYLIVVLSGVLGAVVGVLAGVSIIEWLYPHPMSGEEGMVVVLALLGIPIGGIAGVFTAIMLTPKTVPRREPSQSGR